MYTAMGKSLEDVFIYWQSYCAEVYTNISTELTRHLQTSGATSIFTDRQRLDTAVQAANNVGLPKTSIVIVDQSGKTLARGYRRIQDLLDVVYSWEVICDPEVLADK